MDYYNMSKTERLILINQYKILSKMETDLEGKEYFENQITYLERGYVYLLEENLLLEPIVSKEISLETMDIIQLHNILAHLCKLHRLDLEKLQLDFNYDDEYVGLMLQIINSESYPMYNKLKLVNSHGIKNINDHRKQLNYWKNVLNRKIDLTKDEVIKIQDYRNLP